MQIEIASPYDKMAESGSSLLRLIQNNDTNKLDLLIREALQNCLDAGNKTSRAVNVDFITGRTETDKVCNFFAEIESNLKEKCGNICDFIAIRDTNTVGLTGPIRKADIGEDGKFGNYLKLVTEISKPQDQYGSGGSWGLGKTVYFRIGIGLVVYYSRIKKEDGSYESRLSAALVEDEKKSDAILTDGKGLRRGIAWWGEIDPYDENGKSTIPVTDEQTIKKIVSAFGVDTLDEMSTGTMILIPFINRQQLLDETIPAGHAEDYQIPYWCKTSIEDYIKIAIQRWYAPRIQNEEYKGQYLRVNINGDKITYSKMAPVFQLIQNLYNATPENDNEFNGKKISSKEVEIRNNTFKKGCATAGVVNYLKVTSEDLKMVEPDHLPNPYYYIDKLSSDTMYNDPIVLFTRKPGMIVAYATTGDWTDNIPKCEIGEYIVAIFVANSNNMLSQTDMSLEEYIRGSEKADHKAWEDWTIPGGNPQIIQRIKRGVRKKIKDDFSAMTIGTEEKKNLGLGKMLADMLLPPTDFSCWDDAKGGTAGLGGTGGDGAISTKTGGSVNNTVHVVMKQMALPIFGQSEIVMPVRILFGKQKTAIIEIVVDAEGRTISSSEWEETFGSAFPIVLNGFTVTSVTRGKGKDLVALIGGETDISVDIKIGGINFEFERTAMSGTKKRIKITTGDPDNYVIDGVMRYSLNGVQGTIVLKEEA